MWKSITNLVKSYVIPSSFKNPYGTLFTLGFNNATYYPLFDNFGDHYNDL
ncbi:hypothetical protein [Flavobacterium sp. U410]